MKMNLVSGAKQKVIDPKGFGPMLVSPDKKILAGFESAYQVNVASVWDLSTGQRIFSKNMETDGEYDEQYIQVSKDTKNVLIAKGGSVSVYNIADNRLLYQSANIGYIDKFGSAAANNTLSMFVTGGRNGNVEAYNTKGGRIYTIQAHTSTVRKIVFSPDDKLFIRSLMTTASKCGRPLPAGS